METILIVNANIVNEGKVFAGDVLIKGKRIEAIGNDLSSRGADRIIEAKEQYLFPGAGWAGPGVAAGAGRVSPVYGAIAC